MVDDGQGHGQDQHLGLGDLLERGLGSVVVHLDGRVEHDQSCGVDLDAGSGDPFEDYAMLFELLAEGGFARVVDPHQHPLEGFLDLLM